MSLLLNPVTAQQVSEFIAHPSHALLLEGPTGSGKLTLGMQIVGQLLERPADQLDSYPYLRRIASVDGKAISIEAIRGLEQFLSLKVPSPLAINRIVLIEDAQLLGHEAQNALLKTLEEPPIATVIILLASSNQSLLPTVLSRLQVITIKRAGTDETLQYFAKKGYAATDVKQAISLSGGLPGLMEALLSNEEHPLRPATELARQLLQGTTYQRLLMVDELTKQKPLARDTLFIMQQMAHARLQTVTDTQAQRWHQILKASYDAAEALSSNAQPKLVLDQLMLQLG
ncbi:MAG: holB: polymerase delta subunit [Candidatus Saccharibacteria bacterium]|nr:holB: polymerase delta subunit [Candidatus Saccharibacteria bacterium]